MQIKTRRSGLALSGPGRKFGLSLLPRIAVAGLLTVAFVRLTLYHLLPSVWLLFYGAAAISGTVTLFTPACGNLAMALASGGLHIVFVIWIARKHDG